MHPYGPVAFLGGMAQVPRLLRFLDAAVLNEAAVVLVIEGPHGLVHRGIGQEDRFTSRAIIGVHTTFVLMSCTT